MASYHIARERSILTNAHLYRFHVNSFGFAHTGITEHAYKARIKNLLSQGNPARSGVLTNWTID